MDDLRIRLISSVEEVLPLVLEHPDDRPSN
jgi:hypothetical protein